MYSSEPSLDEIVRAVEARLQRLAVGVVAVSGFGGSGKSTLARELKERLGAPVVGIDEFGTAGACERSSDWSGLDRARLVRQVLAPLKAGERSLSYDSLYDWENWRSRPVTVEVTRVLVVEGIGIFHAELQPFLDFRIWLDVDLQTASRRGIERDIAAGQTSTQTWTDIWVPNDADYSARYHPKDEADLVVRWLAPPGAASADESAHHVSR
ncbi:MAG TPA: hypothetical protein VME46_18745 [Acidimicrobiales bacterium]|nr:hypothetical protein [Acidimicrobiales bacterium]